MDGVILDWETHFHDYMKSRGHKRVYHQDSSYWQERNYPEMSEVEARKTVYNFNTSAWMMGVPAFRDARSGIARLVENGYRFVAITAMGEDPFSLVARRYNLDNLFGKDTFIDITATDMYDPDSKRKALKHWQAPSRVWVEDKPSNAELGTELGYHSFLIDHPHNEDFTSDDIERVNNWSDICNSILDTD